MDVLFVYIMEAHGRDEWYVSSINDDVDQHKTIEDRLAAAKVLLERYPLHEGIRFVLDNMDNDFNATYSSWPFRYWIIDERQTIALKAMPKGDQVDLDSLIVWLENRFPQA